MLDGDRETGTELDTGPSEGGLRTTGGWAETEGRTAGNAGTAAGGLDGVAGSAGTAAVGPGGVAGSAGTAGGGAGGVPAGGAGAAAGGAGVAAGNAGPAVLHGRNPLLVATLIAIAVVAVQALLVPLFAAPSANLEPRDLPVIVAGPAQATAGFAAQLKAARPGAFEITMVADGAAADQALRDREAYAAFVFGPDGMTLHTASAASPTVATLISQAVGQFAQGRTVPVVDVVPTDTDDPRGGGFGAGFLPLTMTSLLFGVALSLFVRGRWARLTGVLAFAALAGLVGTAVLQGWLGILPGAYLADASAVALFVLAAAGTVAGLAALLGRAGIVLGALLVFLVANPLSGVTAAPELLPQPWGQVGQLLPVGAGGTLLRSVAYFDGAGSGAAVLTLAGYAVLGLLLLLLSRPRPVAG